MDELISLRVFSVPIRGQKALHAGSHRIPTPILEGGFFLVSPFFEYSEENEIKTRKIACPKSQL